MFTITLFVGNVDQQYSLAMSTNRICRSVSTNHFCCQYRPSICFQCQLTPTNSPPHLQVISLNTEDWRFYIDPALSLMMVVIILRSVWPLLQESALILLQTVPTHIQVDEIQRRLLENVDGVLAVHEFHVWQLAGDRIIASAHIR